MSEASMSVYDAEIVFGRDRTEEEARETIAQLKDHIYHLRRVADLVARIGPDNLFLDEVENTIIKEEQISCTLKREQVWQARRIMKATEDYDQI